MVSIEGSSLVELVSLIRKGSRAEEMALSKKQTSGNFIAQKWNYRLILTYQYILIWSMKAQK